MTVFRLGIIVLVLASIALSMVYLRWSNAHYAYLTQKAWHQQRLLCYEYQQKRLDLARMKNPRNLLTQLDKWDFDLEGWVPTTPPDGTVRSKATTQPAGAKPKPKTGKDAKGKTTPSASTKDNKTKASDRSTKPGNGAKGKTSEKKTSNKSDRNDKTPAKKSR